MRRKTIKVTLTIAAFVAVILTITFYKQDTRFETFNKHFSAVTDKIVKTINDNPTLAGVAEAQEILDGQIDDLKEELAVLKRVKKSEVSGRTLTNFNDTIKDNHAKMRKLVVGNPNLKDAVKDEQFSEKMKKLLNDYGSIIE